MEPILRCFRVSFYDGSAMLVDAETMADAREKAIELAKAQGGDTRPLRKIECLDPD